MKNSKDKGYQIESNGLSGFTLCIKHLCGHSRTYAYAGLKFAENDVPRMMSIKCPDCRLQQINKTKGA